MKENEVIPAFNILLDEIDRIVSDMNQQGAQLITDGKYDGAKSMITKAKSIIIIREKIHLLESEWGELQVTETKTQVKKQKVRKKGIQNRLEQGLRTPNEAFLLPILQALVQLGGSGRLSEVLDRVEEMMSDQLNKYDYQSIPSNPKIIRWRNNAQWARWKHVQKGYLANDSLRGIWEITEAGRQQVEDTLNTNNLLAERPRPYFHDQAQSKINQDIFQFEPGKRYHRQGDLHDKFGGNRQSGIAPCAEHPLIFLFTSSRGDEFGYQDGWVSEDLYRYTGEGQMGDMEMDRGNLAILNHQEDGRTLHLFKKVDPGLYEYVGQFEYLKHEIKTGTNGEQRQRDIIQFVLKRVHSR